MSTLTPPPGWPDPPDELPAPVTDTHCHLDISRADNGGGPDLEVEQALELARQVGVQRIVQVGCDLEGARWAVQAARKYPQLVAAVALHPNEVPRLAAAGQLDAALAEISSLAEDPVVRAIGETGLDYFRTEPDGFDLQQESLRVHIDLAKRLDKTLVIHDRDAHDDVLRVIDDAGAPKRVVMHCFSGDEDFARACIERGYYLSFAGTVTFKNAAQLRRAAAVTPLAQLLVETDAPFLTPHPHRGRPNATYLMPLTVRTIAQVIGLDLKEVCTAVHNNAETAFGGPWPAKTPPGVSST